MNKLNDEFLFLFSFSHLHSVLPANGAPVSRQRTSRVKEMYTDYVRDQTLQNWKFWIVSSLLKSFCEIVYLLTLR